ncbi:MAG: glycosyl transferase family 2 [Alphaproteobacteria bacterium]|nr:glycosyl transferase family 2 [Alphaproteobacteria bacterium]
MEPYTVAVTSCGRFDLLERTLGSLLPRLEGPVAKLVITEDSGDPAVHDVIRRFSGGGLKFEVLVNEPRIGLIRSIDRLYSRVETEWVFHCEDDWEFFSDGFIGPSFAVLKESDRHSMVGLRSACEFAPGYLGPQLATRCGTAYRVPDPAVARAFAGLSFNPGLRRMRDYRIVGPYADFRALARESRVAGCYLALGYRMAYLAEPAVRHIGDGRHVPDTARPHPFPGRFVRSMRKRSDRLRFKLHPRSDPAARARRRMEEARRNGAISDPDADGGGSARDG